MNDTTPAETEAHPLCTNCFTPVTDDTDFCPACGCPLGATTAIDPIKSIWARGYFYGRLLDGIGPAGKLVAVWLIFGPAMVLIPYEIATAFAQGDIERNPDTAFNMFLVYLPVLVFGAILLWYSTTHYLHTRRALRPSSPNEEQTTKN